MTPRSFNRRGVRRHAWHAALLAAPSTVLLMSPGAPANAQFVINPVFDSSITSDANHATIEATINNAIAFYESKITNNMSISISFVEVNSGLGASSTSFDTVSYASFRAALAAEPADATRTTALAHLPTGSANPANGGSSLDLEQADAIALGLDHSVNPNVSSIFLNTSICNLSRPDSNPNDYDLESVAFHEIDEALGTVSDVASGGNPTGADMYRYDQTGAHTWTSGTGVQAYFSLDGTTRLDQYNQNGQGDYGDWVTHSPAQVQDWAGTPDASPNPVVELTVLDAVGYKVKTTPAPDSVMVVALGIMVTGGSQLLKRHRARK